jgi:hypothetical protein
MPAGTISGKYSSKAYPIANIKKLIVRNALGGIIIIRSANSIKLKCANVVITMNDSDNALDILKTPRAITL